MATTKHDTIQTQTKASQKVNILNDIVSRSIEGDVKMVMPFNGNVNTLQCVPKVHCQLPW